MFYLMSKDIAVAKFENDSMQIENENLLPLYFKKHYDLDGWLKKELLIRTELTPDCWKKRYA